MTALPTPEQFLASPPDPEEDLEDVEQPVEAPAPAPTVAVARTTPRDSLESIADSLQQLTAVVVKRDQAEEAEQARLEAFDDLDAKHATLYALVEEIEGIVKASTSKVSLSVKAAIDRWRDPEVPAEEPTPDAEQPPGHDADVEEWRAYARGRGFDGPDDLDQMNRSQIRTLLGVPQTDGSGES